MYLADTNIFLEILLRQKKSEICKNFLEDNIGDICISDFTLHSIGVILFRENEYDLFSRFIYDTLPLTHLITLQKNRYQEITNIAEEFGLDFDDSYQYSICKDFNLKLATMDQDFRNIRGIDIIFL